MRESMPKTPRPAQQLFAPLFLLEKGPALEENGGAFELWRRRAACTAAALRTRWNLCPFRVAPPAVSDPQ